VPRVAQDLWPLGMPRLIRGVWTPSAPSAGDLFEACITALATGQAFGPNESIDVKQSKPYVAFSPPSNSRHTFSFDPARAQNLLRYAAFFLSQQTGRLTLLLLLSFRPRFHSAGRSGRERASLSSEPGAAAHAGRLVASL
jgi:hypothetical protein